jgi:DNA-binding NarL/FixJ family response regulator
MNRRKFIQIGAAGLALSALGNYAAEFADQKKRVGLIGCGWYGKVDLLRLIQVAPVEVVSLCDVDKQMLAGAAEIIAARQASKKTPRTYHDYREMFKEKDLDMVLIGTPDHWHALPMIAAVEAGADVYVQKPISVDVVEGQAMLAAARKHGSISASSRSAPSAAARRTCARLASSFRKAASAGLGSSRLIATAGVASTTRPTNRHRRIWITRCGLARRPCARSTAVSTPVVGAITWNTATAQSGIWAFTWWTWCVG